MTTVAEAIEILSRYAAGADEVKSLAEQFDIASLRAFDRSTWAGKWTFLDGSILETDGLHNYFTGKAA